MEEWETCQNRFHVLPWRLIKLKPNNIKLMREQMMQHEKHEEYEFGRECHDLNLGLMTKVRGLQRCGSKVKSRSHISCSRECRKCEGKNPHSQMGSHFGNWNPNGLLNL
jgi:hypothetical protein